MLRFKTPRGVKADVLLPKTPVYYYVRRNKQGEWKLGLVSKAHEHLVSIATESDGLGHKMAIAYEDIRLVPSSALLYELQQVELELSEITTGDRSVPMEVDNTTESCPEQTSTEPELSTEASLWCYHPPSRSLVARNKK